MDRGEGVAKLEELQEFSEFSEVDFQAGVVDAEAVSRTVHRKGDQGRDDE